MVTYEELKLKYVADEFEDMAWVDAIDDKVYYVIGMDPFFSDEAFEAALEDVLRQEVENQNQ